VPETVEVSYDLETTLQTLDTLFNFLTESSIYTERSKICANFH